LNLAITVQVRPHLLRLMEDADDVSLWVTLLQPKDAMDSVSIGVQAQSEAAKLALDARVRQRIIR